jgi:hypothetical protein
MQITYWGTDNKFAKVVADEGMWLTSFNEETQDIVFFHSCKSVMALAKKITKYYEITDEKNEELLARQELAMQEDMADDEYSDGLAVSATSSAN